MGSRNKVFAGSRTAETKTMALLNLTQTGATPKQGETSATGSARHPEKLLKPDVNSSGIKAIKDAIPIPRPSITGTESKTTNAGFFRTEDEGRWILTWHMTYASVLPPPSPTRFFTTFFLTKTF